MYYTKIILLLSSFFLSNFTHTMDKKLNPFSLQVLTSKPTIVSQRVYTDNATYQTIYTLYSHGNWHASTQYAANFIIDNNPDTIAQTGKVETLYDATRKKIIFHRDIK